MKQQQPDSDYRKKERGRSLMLDLGMGKVPPQAKELERVILGAIMLEREAFDKVSEILNPECFYVEANQIIFRAMKNLSLKNMPIDVLTVVDQLRHSGQLEGVGGPVAIVQLQQGVVSSANIVHHSKIIFEKYHLRELIKISSSILSMAYQDDADSFVLQDMAEKEINNLGANQTGEMLHIEKVMMQVIDKIEEWRLVDGSITGIPSGFSEIDKATRGWQPGDLIILGARPSTGKTALALNLVKNAATMGKKPVTVGVWSLEMKAVYLGLRMLAAQSKTILYRLQTGKLNDQEMKEIISESANLLSSLSIHFEENYHISFQSLARKARRLKKKEGLGLIVIDYLQLMSGDEKSGNREQEIARISRDLKRLAQELDIPIIALSQLSRESGVKNVTWEYGPPISAIRESGAIEQDADVIMMLWGPSDEEIAKDNSLMGRRKLKIAKQRNGVLITEELNLRADIQLFEAFNEIGSQGNWKPVNNLPPVVNHYEVDKENPF